MSMNKFMHPRNPYRNPPDFKKLALNYPEFRKHANQDLSGKVKLNFKDEGAVWSLTKSLLHKDFNLEVEILKGRLVPTLPLRMNYLLWIEDLIKLYKAKDQKIHGIDIGTGACCIYPLLASRHFSWYMLGTEIDQENYDCAVNNVKRNNLEEFIEVKKVNEGTYMCEILDESIQYDFCMCNPPFFGDNRESKRRHEGVTGPRNAPSGIDVELMTDGGEISFVKAIIDDSMKLNNSIRIYTVMLGCKSSLSTLKKYISQKNVASLAHTMFCQGRTTRWGLAWTYDKSLDLTIGSSKSHKKDQTVSYNHIIPTTPKLTFDLAVQKLLDFFKKHEVNIENELKEKTVLVMTLKARNNSWTNSRKRRREEKRKSSETNQSVEDKLVNAESNEGSSTNEKMKCLKRNIASNNGTEPKKIKLDLMKIDDFLLIVTLTLKDLGKELNLEIMYLEGSGGKDCAHQLLQCLKNELKTICIL